MHSSEKFTHKNLQVSRYIASVINSNARVLRNRIKNLKDSDDNSKVKTSIQGAYTYRDIKNMGSTYWNYEIFELGFIKVKEKRIYPFLFLMCLN